jgi:hypothetical protein
MSARTHTRSPAPDSGGAGVRLPWWAVVLPVIAFVTLLGLMTGAGEAHAATADPSLGAFLERVQHALTGS